MAENHLTPLSPLKMEEHFLGHATLRTADVGRKIREAFSPADAYTLYVLGTVGDVVVHHDDDALVRDSVAVQDLIGVTDISLKRQQKFPHTTAREIREREGLQIGATHSVMQHATLK